MHHSTRRRGLRAIVLTSIALVAAILSGCATTGNTGGGSGTASHKLNIGFVPALYPHPYFITMDEELKADAKKYGYNLIMQSSPEYSPQAQVPILQSLLAKNLDALIVAPTDTNALNAALGQYKAKNIPIFLVDAGISDPSLVVTTIQTNNYQGGATAADALAKLIGDKGTVAVESYEPGSGAGAPRVSGFLDRMKKKHPDIKVLEPLYGKNDPALSATQVSAQLLAHPEIAGIFGTNTASANGAASAVKSAGKTGKVIVVGYDAGPEEIANVRSGQFDMTIGQHPADEGKLAMQAIHDYFNGKKGSIKKNVTTGVTVVTRDNMDDPNISKYFYKS
jgi:ABC-type sugar transport system substrate-binding protein